MNKIPFLLWMLAFYGCEADNPKNRLEISKANKESGEKPETIFWIDTVVENKYLKVYSTPENDWQNLTAEYWNESSKQKVDLDNLGILSTPFTNRIEWVTDQSFALVNGCGTNCIYTLIFNLEQNTPIFQPIYFYPNMEYMTYETDNEQLYIAVNEDTVDYPSFVVIETDSQLKDTIYLPKKWIRGDGSIYQIVEEINIKNGNVKVSQTTDSGTKRSINHQIKLK